MKKFLTMLCAAIMLLQCGAVCCFAGWQPQTESTQVIYSTDFSDYASGEIVNGNDYNWPKDWKITRTGTGKLSKAYANIQKSNVSGWPNEMTGAPYLNLSAVKSPNDTDGKDTEILTAEKEFSLPEGTNGVVRAKFKYSTDHGNYSAPVRLTDEAGKGIAISTYYNSQELVSSNAVIVDGETQAPYDTHDQNANCRICISDILGTGKSGNFPIGNAYGWHYVRWNKFEIAANTTDKKVVTTVGGSEISLGSGIYAVAITWGTDTRIYKGVLPSGMGKFSRLSFSTPEVLVNGKNAYLDDVSIEYTPVVYVNDAEFENWKGVVWGSVSSELSDSQANMLIESDTDDMEDVGAGWTRIFVGRDIDADRVDKMVLAADKKGIKPLMTYVKKTEYDKYGTEAEEAEEMAYLSNLVSRYRGITKYWEIGNEPNLVTGTDTEKLTNYAKHLRDCYKTIKAADADATVILGGISEWKLEEWTKAFAGITVDNKPAYKYFDEVAFHPYADNPGNCVNRVTAFVDAMKSNWGAEMPVWITEVGFHSMSDWDKSKTPGYVASEDIKAQYLTEVMNKLHEKLGNMQRPVLWYILHEAGNTNGYGLTAKSVSDTHVEKTLLAAYSAMKNLTVDKASTELPIYDDFTDCEGKLPAGWTTNLAENTDGVFVKTVKIEDKEYLQLKRDDAAGVFNAERTFELPADGGLVNISFDAETAKQKGYGKSVSLMSGDVVGATIAYDWFDGGSNIALSDNVNKNTVVAAENFMRNTFDFVINCSKETLGGLEPGEFAFTFDPGKNWSKTMVGKLSGGLTSLDKIKVVSGYSKAMEISIDNVKVSLIDVPEIFEIKSAAAGDSAVIELSSSKTSAKGTVAVAAYRTNEDGGKMMSRLVYLQPGFMIAKGTTSITVPLGVVEEGEIYKVFVFETMDNLKPIMASVEF